LNKVTLDVRWRDAIIAGGLLVAVAGLIRNAGSGPNSTSMSNITLTALAFLFSVCQWVLKDKTLFNDTYVSLRRSWRRDPPIEPHPEESNPLENGDYEPLLSFLSMSSLLSLTLILRNFCPQQAFTAGCNRFARGRYIDLTVELLKLY
jgi:hypothetical protein